MSEGLVDPNDAGALAEFGRRWQRNMVFAAPADDPRARRPADIASLVASLFAVILLGWMYRSGGGVDARALDLFDGVPSWLSGLALSIFAFVGIYSIALVVGVAVFGGGRLKLVRDMLLAAALAVVGVFLASYLAGSSFPQLIPEVTARPDYPSFPVVRLAAAMATIGVAGPFLSLPMRKLGHRLIAASSVAAVFQGYGTVTAVAAGLCIGIAASAILHIVFGSGSGIPSRARIEAALAEAGIDVTDIVYLPEQPTGATLVRAEQAHGGPLLVKIYGRDAADAAFAARMWRAVWYRGESGGVLASRLQLAEHEALILLVLERAGVPAMQLVSGSRASTDDVLLVTNWTDGARFGSGADVTSSDLGALWGLLESMHGSRIAHGSIDRDHIVLTENGPVLTDLRSAELLASDEALAADRAQLLVSTALEVGIEPAIEAATGALDRPELIGILPLLQAGILARALQRDLRAEDFDIDELRGQFASRLGVELPDLVQLHRVTWGSVAMVALTVFAAYSLISALTEIGLDSVAEQYSTAIWSWIAVAFLVAQTTNVGEYLTLSGVIGRPVPFGPTMMFRYAISFISLAVPSEAGAIAMSVRYQQKLGVPAVAAIAQGPLLTIFSKGVDVILLLITAQYVGREVETEDVDFGPVVSLVIVVVIAAVIAAVVVAAVPKFRARLMPHLKEGFSAIKGSLTDPERLGKIAVGTILQKILFAITLSASVSAFGADLPFASAIFVNTAVSLFVGLVPVPGGIGVAESAITAGLIAVGIPAEAAVAAAITHRMVTAYIPPVFGWWASRWLTQRDYL